DVADAAAAALDLDPAETGIANLALDLPLQGLDLVDLGEAQVFAIDEAFDAPEEFGAEFRIPGHGPRLDERLPFPSAAQRVVVSPRAGQRASDRAAFALGPQSQVDPVGVTVVGVGRQ